jgi:hypothetical protein
VKRYRIIQRSIRRKPDGTWERREKAPFAIFDEWVGDYCALPASQGRGKPKVLRTLEWPTREGAHEWLIGCAEKWKKWESSPTKKALVPKHWYGFTAPKQSPWEGHTTPMYGPY